MLLVLWLVRFKASGHGEHCTQRRREKEKKMCNEVESFSQRLKGSKSHSKCSE